jgi:hypothetical protein
MKKHSTRTGYTFPIEDGEATLTIIKPLSSEHTDVGDYIIIYEDAHANVHFTILNKEEIMEEYKLKNINLDEIL